jgi:hypothetical protein
VLPVATQFAYAEPTAGAAWWSRSAIATFVAVLRLQGLWVPHG